MAEVDWRRVNIDQFDEDRLDAEQLFDIIATEDSTKVAQDVRQLISRGDATGALAASLLTSDPAPCLSVLGTVKSSDIAVTLKSLSSDDLDALMRAIYKGLASPATNNCAVLLSWHEKVVELGGEGVIVSSEGLMFGRLEDARIFTNGQNTLIPILLRESVLDSVSFRAATKHFEDQVENVDIWLSHFVRHCHDFCAQFTRLEDQACNFHGKSVPVFVESGIVDTDYTVTALSKFSEANRAYWSAIFGHARSMEAMMTEPLVKLQNNELREIRHLKSEFHASQKAFDEAFRYYAQQSKSKEASSLREDAFQLWEKRKAYIKASFDYTIKMSTFRAALDAALIAAFARSYETTSSHTSALASDFVSRPSMGRVLSWSEEMAKSSRDAEELLYSMRIEMEDNIVNLTSPGRDLAEYAPDRKSQGRGGISQARGRPAKQGWLMMRAVSGKPARYSWNRRWCYVKDGSFGWLLNNPKHGGVEESDRYGVLLCNIKVAVQEDRRFCFEVITKDQTFLLQAENEHDLADWMNVFNLAKEAILATQKNNEQAFAVSRAQGAFAVAADGTMDDTTQTPKRGHAKQDSGNHGLSAALATASNVASTLAQPTKLFGKSEELKVLNPFEAQVETTQLAPSTLAPAPLNTALTAHCIADPMTSLAHNPSGLQANHWGSINYGLTRLMSPDDLKVKGFASLLAGPEAAIDTLYAQRDKEQGERVMSDPGSEPVDYTPWLRRQDAQFSSLFPHAKNEHVMMVFRGTRKMSMYKPLFSGRMYMTMRGFYFYAQSAGLTMLQTCLFSEVLSVRVVRQVDHDELLVDIHDIGTTTLLIYLDDAELVKKRIELLLGNYIADEPNPATQVLKALRDMLPDDTGVSAKQGLSSYANGSDAEAEVQKHHDAGHSPHRLKLPKEPVLTEPDEQMLAKTNDLEVMLTAKSTFHMLFGNRSPLWSQAYQLWGVENGEQGMWQPGSDGTMVRSFRYATLQTDSRTGVQRKIDRVDWQTILKRTEHLDYTVLWYRRGLEYPSGDSLFVQMKINVSFVSKMRTRIRTWAGIHWLKPNYLSRGIITSAVMKNLDMLSRHLRHFVERETLDRLGSNSKTSKAVRIYGRVGGPGQVPMAIGKDGAVTMPVFEKMTLWGLTKKNPSTFVKSLAAEAVLLIYTIARVLTSTVSAHSVLATVMVLSLLFNFYLSGMSTVAYWNTRSATRLLRNIDEAPFGLMSRGITLNDIQEIAMNKTIWTPRDGQCYGVFEQLSSLPAASSRYHEAFRTTRNGLSRTRHDLLVAMRMVNGLEAEIVKGEWEAFLVEEQSQCRAAKQLALSDDEQRKINDHCDDCLAYSF
ncbi:hypothetical protein BCR37DRAFT_393082 [Protomyces lactucae-debilis]|uniref:Actin-related protein 2/3 complex subunit 5 n=1 Tax=Protomyces lactucae-debilis TaxID=2754530 RepID=A0A1Y2FDP0_PROLT|nr:uncharacterized protein BCR37DRAFT_393082 [Protomyces lactucae-debilis]ORY82040.1 hypothetical protein BCR37DRAFT_393082 [Protomyces lactucae-debilis]